MNRRAGSAATSYALRDRAGATRSAQVGQIYFGDRKRKWVRFKSALTISKICLATGARWSEAEELRDTQVKDGLIEYARTKSGKTRAVPIDERLEAEILDHAKKNGAAGRIFGYSISAFREGVERAGLTLPDGQMTHVLRHTFASHFMMNGGNILTLRRVLGHANVTMTMRYSHLSPEHLQEANNLNPLARLTLG